MRTTNVIDVSSFFYFEATGDSDQADKFTDPNVAGTDRYPDDEDAESCSCDLLLDENFPLFVNGCNRNRIGELDDVDGCDSSSVVDDDEEDGDEAHSYSRWSSNKKKKKERKKDVNIKNKINNIGVGVEERKKKSSESVDSSQNVLSEREKNRLFWETCLAS